MSRIVLAGLFLCCATVARAQGSFVNWETPHVSPLALTPDGERCLAVNTPDNRLEVFELATGLPVHAASILVGLDPVSVRARTSTEAWVVNHVSDSISLVDLVRGTVTATLQTDDEPCDVVFAGVPQRAFVSCSQPSTVLVFDPADLAAAPARIAIRGEEPRALAVDQAGNRVFVALFESGNQTTILSAGFRQGHFPPDAVSHPAGPYGGQNPPPNAGTAFDPPIAPDLPDPGALSLIVRRNAAGRWLDDNDGDWTELVSGSQSTLSGRTAGWTLLDHDVAVIDTSDLAVTYAGGLMNIVMALAVRPGPGTVTAVGTEATNEVRFEPNVRGTFVRVQLGRFVPHRPDEPTVVDLNPHLTDPDGVPPGEPGTVPAELREKSLGDPRGIVWNAAGSRAWVTGMGSNNVVVLDAQGQRTSAAPIEVGEGPTGIVLDGARAQLYVLNKFESSLSVVATGAGGEIARVPFFDPSPSAVKRGRRHLYDTHETSGTGAVSCASCHVDARMDRIAWDLGDPSGAMKIVDYSQNIAAPGLGPPESYEDWHPMKGPMLTQTLQDIIGKEPHHWRGDRDGLEEFDPAFTGLLGDDESLSAHEMQEFEDFLATIHFPPNPYRNFDNSIPNDVTLTGHYTSGLFGTLDEPLPNGDATVGSAQFRPPFLLDASSIACITCHTHPTGSSTDHRRVGDFLEPFPVGPNGEHHLALAATDGFSQVTRKVPHLRNLYERKGFSLTLPESTAGFGYLHDGSVDTLERLLNEPTFALTSDQQTAHLLAFLLAFGGDSRGTGSLVADDRVPPGPPSQATHAAVGKQVTLTGTPGPAELALLDAMFALGETDAVGVVVKGRLAGLARGWYYTGSDSFQSDRKTQSVSRSSLQGLANPQRELTFTVVPERSERRIGVDRDADGWFDRDELDFGTDPADPDSRPGLPTREQRPDFRPPFFPH